MTNPSADHPTKEAYEAAYKANTRLSGSGLDTTVHYPCPFCAAPDWAATRILDMEKVLQEPHECAACGRTARLLIRRRAPITAITFQLVQVSGPDPAPYLVGLAGREGDGKEPPVMGALPVPEKDFVPPPRPPHPEPPPRPSTTGQVRPRPVMVPLVKPAIVPLGDVHRPPRKPN